MPRKGWIKLHHQLLDNPEWTEEQFTIGQAWVDLLLLAENEEKRFVSGGVVVQQVPGGVYMPKKELMCRWKWSRRRLDKVLSQWEKCGMITVNQIPCVHQNEHQNVHRTKTVITIVKWRFFQGSRPKSEHQNGHQNEQHPKNIYKKGGDNGSSPCPAVGKKTNPSVVRNAEGKWVVIEQ